MGRPGQLKPSAGIVRSNKYFTRTSAMRALPLKRDPNGQRIIHSQDGLLSKPCFVLFSNLLDLDALLIPRRHRVEQDQNDGPLPLDLAFGIKELPPAC